MARKFLQMGFTRSRRYTNYKGGRKYSSQGKAIFPKGTGDPIKAESASIYYSFWKKAENHPEYAKKKELWKQTYG
jgi:hypothetical protein